MAMAAEDDEFYLRYYVGHKGKFGHEFRPDGKLRYANNFNYKNDTMIRKEVFLTPIVLKECRCIISESEPVRVTETNMAMAAEDDEFYLRYYVGHKGNSAMSSLSSSSNQMASFDTPTTPFTRTTPDPQGVFLTPAVLKECRRIISESEVFFLSFASSLFYYYIFFFSKMLISLS
ncbi:hypothetical protein GH714_000132 [Hevea brasiliensis]|uniref:Uncharacterized protein n=1 Tax=Hevea brasiliensis TaxID=3981 RepID=A0A6A6KSM7_HEVBR|nr:hypothetical protein GH714_000132 [Hevea brasiliensis]